MSIFYGIVGRRTDATPAENLKNAGSLEAFLKANPGFIDTAQLAGVAQGFENYFRSDRGQPIVNELRRRTGIDLIQSFHVSPNLNFIDLAEEIHRDLKGGDSERGPKILKQSHLRRLEKIIAERVRDIPLKDLEEALRLQYRNYLMRTIHDKYVFTTRKGVVFPWWHILISDRPHPIIDVLSSVVNPLYLPEEFWHKLEMLSTTQLEDVATTPLTPDQYRRRDLITRIAENEVSKNELEVNSTKEWHTSAKLRDDLLRDMFNKLGGLCRFSLEQLTRIAAGERNAWDETPGDQTRPISHEKSPFSTVDSEIKSIVRLIRQPMDQLLQILHGAIDSGRFATSGPASSDLPPHLGENKARAHVFKGTISA